MRPSFAQTSVLIGCIHCAAPSDPAPTAPAVLETTGPSAAPSPAVNGRWVTLPYLIDYNPVHAVLLHAPISAADRQTPGAEVGTVLVVSGSGDDPNQAVYKSEILDFSAATMVSQDMDFDAFCSGITVLPNGNPLVVGGTMYDPVDPANQELGLGNVEAYKVRTDAFARQPPMANGRWYPTATLLGDGRVMVDSGWDQTAMNDTVEIFTPGGGWTPEFPMGFSPMFYPRQHLLPDGTVIKSGPENETRLFDPAVASEIDTGWTHLAWTNYGGNPNEGTREYGTSVLLSLSPDDGYDARVMIFGGNRFNPTDTTELIDLGDAVPDWRWGPPMSEKRVRMQAVILPNGKVLALGGSSVDLDPSTASLNADLYDPDADAFSSAGQNAYPRLDHSVALLLPDGRVWVAGNQGDPSTFEQHMEYYEPAYLFQPDGSWATRPVITAAPKQVGYGDVFSVRTDGSPIAALSLVRPGAVTHAFNFDQRRIELDFSVRADGSLDAIAPPDGNVAPPGYYMLFATDTAGVPSVAAFVQIR